MVDHEKDTIYIFSIHIFFAIIISICSSSDIYAPLKGISTEHISDVKTDEIGIEKKHCEKRM